jgi:hypothetical protein
MTKELYATLTEQQKEILNAKRREKYKTLPKERKRARTGYRSYSLLSDEQRKNKRQRNREWMRAWAESHPEEARRRSRENYRKHSIKRIAKIAEWKRANPDRVKASNKRSDAKRKPWLKKQPYWNRKYATDVQHRLKRCLRESLRQALRAQNGSKQEGVLTYLGCSVQEFKRHLSSLFKPGMTWGNHGDWHIDHLSPCASFDLTDPGQRRLCYHYTNLQPLWAGDNHRKGARVLSA